MSGYIPRVGQGRPRRHTPMAAINVTPFVDVMLVLLIVFMITAPLLTAGVPVDLPESRAGAVAGRDEPLVLSVTRDGQVFMQETPVPPESLIPRLRAIAGRSSDLRIFVRGDANVPYGTVMAVMGQINAAGFSRVALLTRPPARP